MVPPKNSPWLEDDLVKFLLYDRHRARTPWQRIKTSGSGLWTFDRRLLWTFSKFPISGQWFLEVPFLR